MKVSNFLPEIVAAATTLVHFRFQLAHRKFRRPAERYVSQLIFSRWPEVGLPRPCDLLTFAKAAFSCRQAAGGRVLVHSRLGPDPALAYVVLETMLAQVRFRGEVNLPSYARHLSASHGLALSSADLYVYLHDLLAEAVECGQLHSVMANAVNGGGSNGSLSMPS